MAEQCQLADLARALDAALAERKVPVRAVFGPEATTPTKHKDLVVLEHDGDDSFSQPRSPGGNPPARFNRFVAAVVRIRAQSTLAGATVADHRGRADKLLDHVLICLDNILRGQRRTWRPDGGRFVPLEDPAPANAHSGAVYELRIGFDRAVYDVTWASGDAAPEVTLGGEGGVTITNRTNVHLENGPDDAPAETGCGG